ncbi:MAG: hypothetical protein Roseis3KO_49110 [Roseivirga sp.]
MNKITALLVSLLLLLPALLTAQKSDQKEQNRVISKIDSTRTPELVVIQEFTVKAPLNEVWNAYTTKAGYEKWAVPLAEIELKVGGTIKSNYNPAGAIGDSTTIITHIINYVPRQLITLQAEITDNFPEFMKKEADDFYNVIYFREMEEGHTEVKSFGIGYKNTPKYLELMNYFIPANEMTLMKLIKYLEKE